MITAEWTIPFQLTVPDGHGGTMVLPINTQAYSSGSSGTPLGWYLLDPARCSTGTAKRVTRTNIAQADGEITHRKFKTGYVMELTMELWEDPTNEIACGATLRAMVDELMLFLNAIENADGRIQWTPTGLGGDRMLDAVRILGPSGGGQTGFTSVVQEISANESLVSLTFALITPFPYANDVAITTTALTDGGHEIVDNTGNSDFHPVFHIDGPVSQFTLFNYSNLDEQGAPKAIIYDASLPGGQSIGGGDYAELKTFYNTARLNGLSAPGDNLKPGINITLSDFFTLIPGNNDIQLNGTTGSMIWTPAWA